MTEAAAETTKQSDPMEQFREMRNTYLDIWSKNLIDTVNSEGYAKASGAALDSYLTVAAPLKEPIEQAMLKTLQQLNMPTSADIASLSGRLTNVEMNLDNMDAKLDRIEKLLTGLEATTRTEAKTRAEAAEDRLDRIEKLIASMKASASERPKMQAEPATQVAPLNQVVAMSDEAPGRTVASRTAKNTPQEEETAKPASQNARKGKR
jgi:uncharacterized protein YicC (UPF0701 family)